MNYATPNNQPPGTPDPSDLRQTEPMSDATSNELRHTGHLRHTYELRHNHELSHIAVIEWLLVLKYR